MAEFEEIEEIFEDAEDGFDEASEEAEEATEEEKLEIKEAKEGVNELSNDVKEFKSFSTLEALKSFSIFIAKNIAIGAIFYGVNVTLSKLVHKGGDPGQRQANKRKQDVIKAIIKLIKTEADICKKVADWLKQHKDDTIVLDGITIPLESIFHKYLGSISDAVDQAFKVAKPLQRKIDNNVSWDVPTAEDVGLFIDASIAFLKAFDDFRKFADEKSSEFDVLKSLPLTQDDVDNIRNQLDVVQKMPAY